MRLAARGARLHGARSAAPGLVVVAALIAGLVLLPLIYTLMEASGVAPADAAALLFRPLVARLLANTVGLAVAATLLCALIGVACAWFVERTDLPGRGLWAVLVTVPLAIPAFVTSFAWVSLSPALQDFWGALLVVTSAYFPLVYLPVVAALRGLDPALEETARASGLGPIGCFARVVLPQLRPALLGGMLLVALNTMVEFGAFALLRFRTFTTEIYAEYRTGLDGAGSALLASVLIGLCATCLAAELWVRGRAGYARIGRGVRRPVVRRPLGAARLPVLAGFAALATVTVAVPLGMIVFWLTRHGAAATSPALASLPRLAQATVASVALGLAAAALTIALAMPVAFLALRHRGPLTTLIERSTYLAQGVPGIVVALALVSLTIQTVHSLYQSAVLLIIAYAVLFLPLAVVAARAALAQVQPGLEEAGRTLGLGRAAVIGRVLLPLAGPGLGAAGAMVFVAVVTELPATLLLSPIGTRTLATQVWSNTSAMAFAAAAPFAAAMAAISLLSSWLLARRFGVARLFASP